MKFINQISRRRFLCHSSLACTGIALVPPFLYTKPLFNLHEIHLFSKHLQFLNYQDAAKKAKELGFSGLEITVRPRGHVLPENVARDLPIFTKAIRDQGLKVRGIVTSIESDEDPVTHQILETASELNIEQYRVGWWDYLPDTSISESIQKRNILIHNLSQLNKDYNITGCYQNHAGTRMGASLWELDQMMDGVDPNYFGVHFDIRHTVVEGGLSWKSALKLIAPRIKMIVIKDFIWGMKNDSWQPINIPLGKGMVDWVAYFKMLAELKINLPISLHLEYPIGGAEHGALEIEDEDIVYSAMESDLSYLNGLIGN